VRLEWQHPTGVQREMTFVDTYQTDHIFNHLVPNDEPVEAHTGYALPLVRNVPSTFYRIGAHVHRDKKETKPKPGVWTIELPSNPSEFEILALVDPSNPDVAIPFLRESFSGARNMLRRVFGFPIELQDTGSPGRSVLRPLFGLPFCLCGLVAALPFLIICVTKISYPLLADVWIPTRLQGYDSAHTVSRYLPTMGLWDLTALSIAVRCGLVAVLGFCVCCALPWWQLYARYLLSDVNDATEDDLDDLQQEESERLLGGN